MLSKYVAAPYRIYADLPVHVLEDEKGHPNGKGQSLPCAALYLLSFLQGRIFFGELESISPEYIQCFSYMQNKEFGRLRKTLLGKYKCVCGLVRRARSGSGIGSCFREASKRLEANGYKGRMDKSSGVWGKVISSIWRKVAFGNSDLLMESSASPFCFNR